MKDRVFKGNSVRKLGESRGMIIVFIGVDGSGKSTLTRDVSSWLSSEGYSVSRIYLGSGEGKVNFFTSVVNSLIKASSYIRAKSASRNKLEDSGATKTLKLLKSPLGYCGTYLRALSLYAVTKDNKRKLINMHESRKNGGISVIDRFPQMQQKNINDGPKLENYSIRLNSRFLAILARREISLLKVVETVQPDLVFRLNISAEVSMKRKPEHTNIDYLDYKAQTIKNIAFPKSKVFDVDAERNYEQVCSEIKRIISLQLVGKGSLS